MNHSLNNRADDLLDRLSDSLTRWVLGFGLLSLHATLFTVSMIAMLLWNIYSAPGDLWVDEVFRRWGAVLAFHAIAVVAGTIAWQLLRAEQQAMDAQRVEPSPLARPVPIASFDHGEAPNAWRPGISVPGNPAQRYAETAHKAEDLAKRAFSASAVWSAAVARRTKQAVVATKTKWTHRRDQPEPPTPAVTDPTMTWPQVPVRHRTEDQEFISRFAASAPSQVEPPATSEPGGVDIVLDVASVSPPSGAEAGATHTVGKEPGQSWLEAATHAWHLPRSQDGEAPPAESERQEVAPDAAPADPDHQSTSQ